MQRPVGRDSELASIGAFLTAAGAAPAVLELTAEAGMGKTTLARHAAQLAREAGAGVLQCRPTSAESTFSFAGLTDLLSGVEEAEFGKIPAPQRRALHVALLRAEPASGATDERAIGTGTASLLTEIATGRPLVVVVDDLQWLDQPSSQALHFALRRLTGVPFGLLVARRSASTPSADLAGAVVDPAWSRSITLKGLTLAALFHVIRDHLGVTFSRPVLRQITDASAGNPFLALELARAVQEAPGEAMDHLVVPESLQSLTAARLSKLSDGARRAVLAVACSAGPTLTLLEQLGLEAGVHEAEQAGVLVVHGARIEFQHPLLASASIDLASRSETLAVHATLAEAATDPEARARHSALATLGPDESVALALDEAGASASARGAASAAFELAQLAVARTVDPTGAAAWERRVRLAERLHFVGATTEAGRELEHLGDRCPPGAVRCRGWLVLTEVAYQTASVQDAVECARAALVDAGDDPELRARSLLSLAAITTSGEESARLAAEARGCLESALVVDAQLLAWAACQEVSAAFHLGQGLDKQALDEALRLEQSGDWSTGYQVATVRPVLLKWADFHQEALDALAELKTAAEETGNDGLVPYAVGHVPGVLLRLGRTEEAAAAAGEHLAYAEAAGQDSQRIQALYNVSLVDAYAGRLAEARTAAEQVLAAAERHDDRWLEMSAVSVMGVVSLSEGLGPEARTWFDRWFAAHEALGLIDPGVSRFHGDHIEALLLAGARDEATQRIDELAARAERAGRFSSLAVAERCRALLAAAAGNLDEALAHADLAHVLHRRALVPFERARTSYVEGVIQRRAKHKRAAAEALDDALATFTDVGARVWADRARAERERVGGRTDDPTELTASERRVAELTASGLTNRQVAERAFISPKTVEANLARVYRKLGISSRAELGSWMSSSRPDVDEPPKR